MGFQKSYQMLSVFVLMLMVVSSLAVDISIISYDHGNPKQNSIHTKSDEQALFIFEEWQVKHNKVYNGLGEKQKKFDIFKDNLKFIEEHNAKKESYQLGLNQFSDLTFEEFSSMYLRGDYDLPLTANIQYEPPEDLQVPSSIDWRSKGAVTPVKNQGNCGSCWTFGVIAAVEGFMKIVTGKITPLSEQEVMDCNVKGYGCNGGLQEATYGYIIENGGITSSRNYPYKARRGPCQENKREDKVFSIENYGQVQKSERSLQIAVARQPISVSIDASSREFQHYKKGVYTKACTNKTNHAVAVVGYGFSSSLNLDYWIIKNSWGANWGENGYIRLERNVTFYGGKCGITQRAFYPIMEVFNELNKPYQPY